MTTLTPISTRSAAKLCSNCGKASPLKKGRCRACYDYHHRTGEERPPWYGTNAQVTSDDAIRDFHARYMKGEPVAALAEEAGVKPVTVHDWFRRLKLPLQKPPKAKLVCSNCGRTISRPRFGRCDPCYQWHRIYNEERPLDEEVRSALRRTRLAPDDVVLKLHVRYMDGESITALATEAGITRPTLRRRFSDLRLEQRGHNVPRPCSMCGRKMVLNEHGICRSCTREAARFRCPRCSIVVPVELAKGEVCDMCKDDVARSAARWRRPTAATITPKAQNSRPVQCNAD